VWRGVDCPCVAIASHGNSDPTAQDGEPVHNLVLLNVSTSGKWAAFPDWVTIHQKPWDEDPEELKEGNMMFPSLQVLCNALPELTERIDPSSGARAQQDSAHDADTADPQRPRQNPESDMGKSDVIHQAFEGQQGPGKDGCPLYAPSHDSAGLLTGLRSLSGRSLEHPIVY